MKSSKAILLAINLISVGWCFLTDPYLFEGNPELCSELNLTLFQKIGDILNRDSITEDNNVSISSNKSRKKRSDYVDVKLSKPYENSNVEMNFRINIPNGFNFSATKDAKKLPNVIDPATFKVKVFYFFKSRKENEHFVLITGERCKYRFNGKSGNYERELCWYRPSFCRGTVRNCLQNDGADSLCYDEVTGKGNKLIEDNVELPNIGGKGLLESWKTDYYLIFESGYVNVVEDANFSFLCYNYGEANKTATCLVTSSAGYGLNAIALKTISGYAG